MDVISQLQDQLNHTAFLLFNFVGTLQRDAPPAPSKGGGQPTEEMKAIHESSAEMATSFVRAANLFDVMVGALPLEEGGEEAQLQKIAQLQAENESTERELAKELNAAEAQLARVRRLFGQAADACFQFKNEETQETRET